MYLKLMVSICWLICWQIKYFLTIFYLEILKYSFIRLLIWHCQLRFASILTPNYFTLSVGYSILPYSLTFKSPSNFSCLDLKIAISVFLRLSEILFAFNQLTICFKSALAILYSFLIELLRHNKLVSSVKWWNLQNFIALLR